MSRVVYTDRCTCNEDSTHYGIIPPYETVLKRGIRENIAQHFIGKAIRRVCDYHIEPIRLPAPYESQYRSLKKFDKIVAYQEKKESKTQSFFPLALLRRVVNTKNMAASDLQACSLANAKVRKINFNKSKLNDMILSRSDFQKGTFIQANLSNGIWNESNLSYGCLRGANISGTQFLNANLAHADLSEVIADHRTNFTGANLHQATLPAFEFGTRPLGIVRPLRLTQDPTESSKEYLLLLLPAEWTPNNLDRILHYGDNTESGSLLLTIDAQDDGEKRALASQLMDSLIASQVDLTAVAIPILSVFSKSPYTDDAQICTCLDRIAYDLIDRYQHEELPSLTTTKLLFIADIFKKTPQLMFSHNTVFIQLIARMTATGSLSTTLAKADSLYKDYLADSRIQPYTKKIEFDLSDEGNVDWGDQQSMLFALSSSPENAYMMLLSRNTLRGLLSSVPRENSDALDKFSLYKQIDAGPQSQAAQGVDLDSLFGQHFHVFNAPYQSSLSRSRFANVLSSLQLDADLHALFDAALRVRQKKEKLISREQEERLDATFAAVLNQEESLPSLLPAHRDAILSILFPSSATNKDKAGALMCLSAVFVKYSSSAMFGTEAQSPYPIRHYAYALMAEAHSLAEDEFSGVFTDWKARLLGARRGTASCTALLYGDMHPHIISKFPALATYIIPPGWN